MKIIEKCLRDIKIAGTAEQLPVPANTFFILLLGQFVSQPHNFRGQLLMTFLRDMVVNRIGRNYDGNPNHTDDNTGDKELFCFSSFGIYFSRIFRISSCCFAE